MLLSPYRNQSTERIRKSLVGHPGTGTRFIGALERRSLLCIPSLLLLPIQRKDEVSRRQAEKWGPSERVSQPKSLGYLRVEIGCTLQDHFWNRQWSAKAGRTESWVRVLPVAKDGHTEGVPRSLSLIVLPSCTIAPRHSWPCSGPAWHSGW